MGSQKPRISITSNKREKESSCLSPSHHLQGMLQPRDSAGQGFSLIQLTPHLNAQRIVDEIKMMMLAKLQEKRVDEVHRRS